MVGPQLAKANLGGRHHLKTRNKKKKKIIYLYINVVSCYLSHTESLRKVQSNKEIHKVLQYYQLLQVTVEIDEKLQSKKEKVKERSRL